MDSFYPTQAAAQAIVEWNERLCKEDAPLIKIGMAWPATALNSELVTIKEVNGGQSAKAMFPTTGQHRQEAVFTIVGALKTKDLPPVKGVNMKNERIKFARQHASVTGWDAEFFKRALDNMREVGYTMYSAFSEGAVEPWRPEPTEDGNAEISSNCRYFTVGRNIPANSRTDFHPKTDPHGVLARYLSDHVAHCFDNEVMYMALKEEEYVDKDPSTFKTGDIVEMGFAFVAWKKPGRNVGPEWTCMLVLRTLTFLDGRFTKEAHFAREAYKAEQAKKATATGMGHAGNQLPKRRITTSVESDDEEGASAAKKLHMLTICDQSSRSYNA